LTLNINQKLITYNVAWLVFYWCQPKGTLENVPVRTWQKIIEKLSFFKGKLNNSNKSNTLQEKTKTFCSFKFVKEVLLTNVFRKKRNCKIFLSLQFFKIKYETNNLDPVFKSKDEILNWLRWWTSWDARLRKLLDSQNVTKDRVLRTHHVTVYVLRKLKGISAERFPGNEVF
jgi:hypothetical protein